MQGWKKIALGASSLVLMMSLAACDRVDNTEMPQPPQANVEINRQGMDGAKDEKQAEGVRNSTATMGAAPDSGRQ